MGQTVDDQALNTLFREARSYTTWQPRPVTDDMLRDLYDLLKWAPTSANAAPARFAFLRSKEAKERLRPALAPLNVEKTMTAPITVIVAYDLKFYEQLPKLFPQNPGMAKLFESSPEMVETTAKRNSSLQGASGTVIQARCTRAFVGWGSPRRARCCSGGRPWKNCAAILLARPPSKAPATRQSTERAHA